ncbi:MAG: MMPL family transporter [Dehalococcoidia bacterium]|nr:MMPL family transporter [Dehalococcoidia bacterium]MDW8119814.1 MMPL family transporter [Chloroflexota bacterium]
MLYRWGLLMVRWRWVVLGVWVILLALALPLAPRAGEYLKSGFGRADVESERALTLLKERFGLAEATITFVFQHPTLRATDPAFIALEEQALAPLRSHPAVRDIITHYGSLNPRMVSADGDTAYALVFLRGSIDDAMDIYEDLRRLVATPPEMQMWATGGIPIFSEVQHIAERDLRRAEVITLPIVLVALVLVFGGLVAAAVPLIVGAAGVAVTLALIALLSRTTDISIFALNIATVLGLGMAVDYALLVVSRFREELRQHPRDEAVAIAVDRAGRALAFSGLTTILGLSGLLLFQYMMLRSIGVGGILVVAFSMVAALTALPALLAVLGARVNALSILPMREVQETWWRRIALAVMRRPWVVIAVVLGVLLLMGSPFLRVRIGALWSSILPPGAEARQGWEVLAQEFGEGELAPILVTVQDPQGILRPEAVQRLYTFAQSLAQDPRVGRVESIVTLDPRLTAEQYAALYAHPTEIPDPALRSAVETLARPDVTYMRVYSKHPPLSEESKALVRSIRQQGATTGFTVMVTGATADIMDAVDLMYGQFPWVVVYVAGAIYLSLLVLFRSVVLPLKAVMLNTLSILASYGALVFIFQEGNFSGLLRFEAEGYTEATIPILLFCVLFGLSMDYEVFMLARIKEEYDATRDNTRSVALGLEKTGRIVTSAAFILFVVCASFVIGDIVLIKALGVGVALAVLLDATVVRALLVPATMRVLGDWNWWAPGWLRGQPVRSRP